MNQPGSWMRAEIAEQPDVLALLCSDNPDAESVGGLIRSFGPRTAILAGRGTSDHAAAFGKYLAETMLGLPCGLASMSTLSVLESRVDFDAVVWIAVSQSGESPDLVASTALAAEAGALTIAVTNRPESALARQSRHVVPLRCGEERSVAATKTFTAELLTLRIMLGAAAGASRPDPDRVAYCASTVLDENGGLRLLPEVATAERVLYVGRGLTWPIASEGALKLIETTGTTALAYASADLLHGPIAMVRRDDPVVVCMPATALAASVQPTLTRLADRGARTSVVGTSPDADVVVPPSGDEAVDAILQILPLQQLCLERALSLGLDPDVPDGLSKVTLTR